LDYHQIIMTNPVNPRFQRLALVTGLDTINALAAARVLIFGLGGVGSWAAEALARSGLGHLTLVDSDSVCVTNINRQAQATGRTVGRMKTDALAERLHDIHPDCEITCISKVFEKVTLPAESAASPELPPAWDATAAAFGITRDAYVIDAIDSIRCKLDLIETCAAVGATLYSSMGTAQKLDPTQLRVADIWKTDGCPLARMVRGGLRKRGFTGHFQADYSPEQIPLVTDIPVSCGTGKCLCPARALCGAGDAVEWCSKKAVINGSAMPVTATAGMILASLVLRDVYEKAGRDV
jgi:tRNA A37 threonylcarbamoyladenosine dehydratase